MISAIMYELSNSDNILEYICKTILITLPNNPGANECAIDWTISLMSGNKSYDIESKTIEKFKLRQLYEFNYQECFKTDVGIFYPKPKVKWNMETCHPKTKSFSETGTVL